MPIIVGRFWLEFNISRAEYGRPASYFRDPAIAYAFVVNSAILFADIPDTGE